MLKGTLILAATVLAACGGPEVIPEPATEDVLAPGYSEAERWQPTVREASPAMLPGTSDARKPGRLAPNREGVVGYREALDEVNSDPCRDLLICRLAGKCSAGPDGGCIAAYDEDCRAALLCQAYGNCTRTLQHGAWTCLPASDEDCAQSDRCHELGACRLGDDGFCR